MLKRTARSAMLLLCCAGCLPAVPAADEDLAPQLPPAIYAVVGQPLSIYYDNLVLTREPAAYRYDVTCDLGEAGERAWTVTPTAGQAGEHAWAVKVSDAAGTVYGEAKSTLHVAPADAGAGKPFKLLIVGDSLTHATVYPAKLGELLSAAGGPQWTMLGTNSRGAVPETIHHEGYGGWTWARFANHWEPEPDGTYKKMSSPFLFMVRDQPTLDVARYFDEKCGGARPDVITVMLGINDCFGAPYQDPAGIDARAEQMFGYAETLLAAFREAAPDAVIGIALTTPPNSRQGAFEANYGDKYTRWGWKTIQHRLVQDEIAHFGGRQNEGLRLVPVELDVDPIDGYPDNNGVHPNTVGYTQIARSFHAWLKNLWAE